MHYLSVIFASAIALTQPTENIEQQQPQSLVEASSEGVVTRNGMGCEEESAIAERDSDSLRDFLRSARTREIERQTGGGRN